MDVATSPETIMRRRLFSALLAMTIVPTSAGAVGFATQLSCASDYYAYCSQHAVGSPGLRKCMRANGPRLSKSCINALIADGEVSKAEVERTKAKLIAEKNKAKQKKQEAAELAKAKAKKAEQAIAQPKPSKPKSETVAKLSDDDGAVDKRQARQVEKSEPTDTPDKTKAAALQSDPSSAETPSSLQEPAPTLTLDEKTYEAFKSRAAAFVVEDDTTDTATTGDSVSDPAAPLQGASDTSPIADPSAGEAAAPVDAMQTESLGESQSSRDNQGLSEPQSVKTNGPSSANDSSDAQSVTEDAPSATAPTTPPPARVKSTARSGTAQRPSAKQEYPDGKMSLGKASSGRQALRPVPEPAKGWQDFMSSRFNGGFNFEGSDAGFARRGR